MKLKTLRSLKKRIKITGRGKLLHYRAGKSHLLTGKRKARKKRLAQPTTLKKSEVKKLKGLLPY